MLFLSRVFLYNPSSQIKNRQCEWKDGSCSNDRDSNSKNCDSVIKLTFLNTVPIHTHFYNVFS